MENVRVDDDCCAQSVRVADRESGQSGLGTITVKRKSSHNPEILEEIPPSVMRTDDFPRRLQTSVRRESIPRVCESSYQERSM